MYGFPENPFNHLVKNWLLQLRRARSNRARSNCSMNMNDEYECQ